MRWSEKSVIVNEVSCYESYQVKLLNTLLKCLLDHFHHSYYYANQRRLYIYNYPHTKSARVQSLPTQYNYNRLLGSVTTYFIYQYPCLYQVPIYLTYIYQGQPIGIYRCDNIILIFHLVLDIIQGVT